jgi:hypothetical protein
MATRMGCMGFCLRKWFMVGCVGRVGFAKPNRDGLQSFPVMRKNILTLHQDIQSQVGLQ